MRYYDADGTLQLVEMVAESGRDFTVAPRGQTFSRPQRPTAPRFDLASFRAAFQQQLLAARVADELAVLMRQPG